PDDPAADDPPPARLHHPLQRRPTAGGGAVDQGAGDRGGASARGRTHRPHQRLRHVHAYPAPGRAGRGHPDHPAPAHRRIPGECLLLLGGVMTFLTVAGLTLRTLFGRRRFLLLLPLPALVVGLAVLAETFGADPAEWGSGVLVGLGFAVVLPVL